MYGRIQLGPELNRDFWCIHFSLYVKRRGPHVVLRSSESPIYNVAGYFQDFLLRIRDILHLNLGWESNVMKDLSWAF